MEVGSMKLSTLLTTGLVFIGMSTPDLANPALLPEYPGYPPTSDVC
jgi:hypothetical protein